MRACGIALAYVLALASPAAAQTTPSDQAPGQLCVCRGDDSARKGGVATFEAFEKRYGATFKSPDETKLAWAVYQAVNRCDAVIAIGRLEDTGPFLGKPGYCVLRDLKPWTPAINDAFIHAGTDRQSRFLLVSPVPMETMSDAGGRSFPVVYNREIRTIQDTHRYKRDGEPDQFSVKKPGRYDPLPCYDVSGAWSGKLAVTEVRGKSNVQPGLSRNAAVTVVQDGCRVRLQLTGNDIAGYLLPQDGPPLVTGELGEVAAGTVVKARLTIPPGGPLQLEIEQQTAGASIVSSGRLTRGR